MVAKSEKNVVARDHGNESQVDKAANTSSSNAGKRKKGKRKNQSKKNSKTDQSTMKSIKQSIRNRFQRIKGSGGKSRQHKQLPEEQQQGYPIENHSSITDSIVTELDEMALQSPRGTTVVKDIAKETKPPASSGKKTPPVNKEGKKSSGSSSRRSITPKKNRDSTPKKRRQSPKSPKEKKKELPALAQKPKAAVKNIKKQLQKQVPMEKKAPKRTEVDKVEPDLSNVRYEMKRNARKKIDDYKQKHHFRSFSDSSDYSDTDFDRDELASEASSEFYDNDFDEPSSFRDSRSDSEDSYSGSDSFRSEYGTSASYTSDSEEEEEEEEFTMRTERSAVHRNPGTNGRGRSRKPRRLTPSTSNHISSPRSSPRKGDSHHIRSPRRGGAAFHSEEESSFASGTSYDDESSGSEVSGDSSSGSSYSETESDEDDGSETNDEYDSTSYDEDPRAHRNIPHRNSTYSDSSWTGNPVATFGSEDTESQKLPADHYPTLLGNPTSRSSVGSLDDTEYRVESRSTMNESIDLGSIAETEYGAFVKEQEAVEESEQKRLATLAAQGLKIQKQKVKSEENSGGVFSWIFGGPAAETDEDVEEEKDNVRDEEEVIHTINLKKAPPKAFLSSPPLSPRTTRSQRSIRSPRTPNSPRATRSHHSSMMSPLSAESSRNDFIVRDRRSHIFLQDDVHHRSEDNNDPTMSPGCSVSLNQILDGSGSMPNSYGGLKEGEYLLSDLESGISREGRMSREELSATLRGSGTFDTKNKEISQHAPSEIAFSLQPSPSVLSSPTKSRRAESYMIADERQGESDFLYCCYSPRTDDENGPKREDLPLVSTKLEKDFAVNEPAEETGSSFHNVINDVVSALGDDEVDNTTCASTINTEGFRDISGARSKSADTPLQSGAAEEEKSVSHSIKDALSKSSELPLSTRGSAEEKSFQYLMVPIDTADVQDEKGDEESSYGEKIEMELGSYISPVNSPSSYDGDDMEQGGQVSEKRIKAEVMDDYDISEILRGKKTYKSKTDENGLPLPVSRPSTPTGKRERRKKALKAARDFLYKSHSIDTNTESPEDGADGTSKRSRATNVSDSVCAINGAEEDKKSSGGDNSSGGPSVLSNSIVQDDVLVENGNDTPDALIEVFRNAFNFMSPKNDESTAVDNSNSVSTDAAPDNADSKVPPSGPMDDMLEVAYRFFVPPPPKEEDPLIIEGKKEPLIVMNFDPNLGNGSDKNINENINSAVGESNDIPSTEESSSSMDNTNLSSEAVLKNSRSKTSSHHVRDIIQDKTRFNADGIPLELRPKKIWRAFDSGFSSTPSVLTSDTGSYYQGVGESRPKESDASKKSISAKIQEVPECDPKESDVSTKMLVDNNQDSAERSPEEENMAMEAIPENNREEAERPPEETNISTTKSISDNSQELVEDLSKESNVSTEPLTNIDEEQEKIPSETVVEQNDEIVVVEQNDEIVVEKNDEPEIEPLDSIYSIGEADDFENKVGEEEVMDNCPSKSFETTVEDIKPEKKQLQVNTETQPEPKQEREESNSRLSSSARFRRRNDLKRLKKLRLGGEKSPVPATWENGNEESRSLSPRKQPRESFVDFPKSASLSPTKQRREIGSPMKQQQHFTFESTTEDELGLATKASPPISDLEQTAMESPRASPVSPLSTEEKPMFTPRSKNNISDIRQRIKQRRKTKYRQQQHEREASRSNHTIEVSVPTKGSFVMASGNHEKGVKAITDRRDDSASSMDGADEFFDAITYETPSFKDEPPSKQDKVTRQQKYLASPEQDRLYVQISPKESTLSSAFSLD